jgi:sugar phosphate isomerase/epimerase
MTQGGVAVQLYTVRQFMQTREDIAKSLHRIREIGYRAVQSAGFGPLSPAEYRELLDREGLTLCGTHDSYEEMQTDLNKLIAERKVLGTDQVCIAYLAKQYRENGASDWVKFAKAASEIGKRLADAGLTLSYHNHSFEFERFGKQSALEIFYAEADPRYVKAEIDTYWVQHGGGDPAAWCARVKGRTSLVHFKDMTIIDGAQAMAEVGEGNLNWPAILKACRDAGVQWYIVEQDVCQRDPFESLAMSLENLRSWGLS